MLSKVLKFIFCTILQELVLFQQRNVSPKRLTVSFLLRIQNIFLIEKKTDNNHFRGAIYIYLCLPLYNSNVRYFEMKSTRFDCKYQNTMSWAICLYIYHLSLLIASAAVHSKVAILLLFTHCLLLLQLCLEFLCLVLVLWVGSCCPL